MGPAYFPTILGGVLIAIGANSAYGLVFSKLGCEAAPILLAFILGPLMEEYLRRAILLRAATPGCSSSG